MKTTILLPSFKRPELLNLGLASLLHFKPTIDFEIIVLNDGIPDGTEEVCKKYEEPLNVRYIFTGQRNLDGVIKHRVPGFALNIGIRQAKGEFIILSCPEMYHLNNSIDIISKTVEIHRNYQKYMIIPDFIYFDQKNLLTSHLLKLGAFEEKINYTLLTSGDFGKCHVEMPYVFGVMKKHLIEIGGYDEDFTGYAGEDCDLIMRLKKIGLLYRRVGAKAIHLFHEGTGDGGFHYENPAWVHNYNLLLNRKGIIKRNVGRRWGVIE